ncbi:MAG: hypothetical protein ACRENA_10080 [Vulcanimicrobiaceae bacterium]
MTAAVYNGAAVSISSITNATIVDNGGGGSNNVLAAAWVGAGVSSITVNTSAAGSHVYVEVDEYSGIDTTTPVDKHTAPVGVAYAATCSPSALTPTQAGDLAVEYIANFTNSSSPVQGTYSTAPSTTTAIEGNAGGGILALEGSSNYTGTSAITGTWAWSTAQEEQCGFLLLNPASTTLVQRTACSSDATQNLPCTLTATIATGDIGIVTAAVYNSSAVSISSITNATVVDNGGGGSNNVLAAAWVGAGVSSVTVNTSAAGSSVYVEVDEYSGIDTTTPVDKHTAPVGVAYAATCSPSALTPTQTGDLAIEYIANFTNSSSPVHGTYSTSPSTTTAIEGNTSGGILALQGSSNYTGTGAITGTWTWSAAQEEQCGLLLLNPTGVTPTPTPWPTASWSDANYVNIQNSAPWP